MADEEGSQGEREEERDEGVNEERVGEEDEGVNEEREGEEDEWAEKEREEEEDEDIDEEREGEEDEWAKKEREEEEDEEKDEVREVVEDLLDEVVGEDEDEMKELLDAMVAEDDEEYLPRPPDMSWSAEGRPSVISHISWDADAASFTAIVPGTDMRKGPPAIDDVNLDVASFTMGADEGPDPDETARMNIYQKIELPILWATLSTGVRIVDLRPDLYPQAIAIVNRYYAREEVCCRSLDLSKEPESLKALEDSVTYWMHDGTSIAAIQDPTEMLGMIVTRIIIKQDLNREFSSIRLVAGETEAYREYMRVRHHLHFKCDIFKLFNCQSYMRVYLLAVRPKHRGEGLGMALLMSALRLAGLMKQPILMGIFSSRRMQSLARKLGMRTCFALYYSQWVEGTEYVFDNPGCGNYTISVMAMRVPQPE